MDDRAIQKAVIHFRKTFRIRDINVTTLTHAMEAQGYTVIEFRRVNNDPEVALLLRNLHLEDRAVYSRGFTYADSHYRMVFIGEDLTEHEKTLILAHEQGHIYLGHMNHLTVIGVDVQEEYEANEFVHYLLHPVLIQRLGQAVKNHFVPICICIVLLAAAVAGGIKYREFKDSETYFMEYYVTPHGTKYHVKECGIIEGKEVRRLTKDDIESGEFEPCSLCIP